MFDGTFEEPRPGPPSLDAIVASRRAELEDLDARVATRRAELAALDAEVTVRRSELAALDATLTRSRESIDDEVAELPASEGAAEPPPSDAPADTHRDGQSERPVSDDQTDREALLDDLERTIRAAEALDQNASVSDLRDTGQRLARLLIDVARDRSLWNELRRHGPAGAKWSDQARLRLLMLRDIDWEAVLRGLPYADAISYDDPHLRLDLDREIGRILVGEAVDLRHTRRDMVRLAGYLKRASSDGRTPVEGLYALVREVANVAKGVLMLVGAALLGSEALGQLLPDVTLLAGREVQVAVAAIATGLLLHQLEKGMDRLVDARTGDARTGLPAVQRSLNAMDDEFSRSCAELVDQWDQARDVGATRELVETTNSFVSVQTARLHLASDAAVESSWAGRGYRDSCTALADTLLALRWQLEAMELDETSRSNVAANLLSAREQARALCRREWWNLGTAPVDGVRSTQMPERLARARAEMARLRASPKVPRTPPPAEVLAPPDRRMLGTSARLPGPDRRNRGIGGFGRSR